jgi:SAM-dependent methyltransferase
VDPCEAHQLGAADELGHWWIRTRCAYLDRAVRRLLAARGGAGGVAVLEIGCGTAQNLRYLRGESAVAAAIARVTGIEPGRRPDEPAPSWMRPGDGILPSVAALDPSRRYDLLVAMDVLEHVDDDAGALASWVRHVAAGGHVFVTVPAFPRLWSYHDEVLGHKRRYTAASLRALAVRAGLAVDAIRYAFGHAVVPAYLRRVLLAPRAGAVETDLRMPPAWLNRLLLTLGRLECGLGGNPWLGTSLLGFLRVPSGERS